MKDIIKQLEEAVELPYEGWAEVTLFKIIQTEELFKLFTPELATYLFDNRRNDLLYDILLPVKYGYQIREVKQTINKLLQQHIDEDLEITTVIEDIINMKDDDNVFTKAGAYLTILALFKETVDVSEYKEDIVKTLNELISIAETINVKDGIEVIEEILNLIIPIREFYFEKHEIDLLSDTTKLKELFDSINNEIDIDRILDETPEDIIDKEDEESQE